MAVSEAKNPIAIFEIRCERKSCHHTVLLRRSLDEIPTTIQAAEKSLGVLPLEDHTDFYREVRTAQRNHLAQARPEVKFLGEAGVEYIVRSELLQPNILRIY